jgi:hypothetical protein
MAVNIEKSVFIAEVRDGKLLFQNPKRFDLFVQQMKGKVTVHIERMKKVRTTGQAGERSNMNGYYWLYLTVIADETGDNVDDLHTYFKAKLLPPRLAHILGQTVRMPATTTELTGAEMMDYMMRIEQVCGVPIPPHPDDNQ